MGLIIERIDHVVVNCRNVDATAASSRPAVSRLGPTLRFYGCGNANVKDCSDGLLQYIALLCILAGMKLTKDLVAASAAPLVLSILEEGESYGYAIIQRVRELSGGEIEWTDGMLYPVLHRLQEQGFITAHWLESEAGRKRKYYALTRQGRKALAEQKNQWLFVHGMLARLWGAY